VRVGDRVSKATELTKIDDNSGLEIYMNVPVDQATKLRTGCRSTSSTGPARYS
jgi:hypothetical protein